jgi:tyrosyl-tRNA synthetase
LEVNVSDKASGSDEVSVSKQVSVLDVLIENKIVSSKSEGRRLIAQRGVRLNREVVTDPSQPFPREGILQIGKRKHFKIVG